MQELVQEFALTIVVPLAVIGLVWILSDLVLPLLYSFYAFFLRPSRAPRQFGRWAVVTGATDGIGKALAFEMARKDMNVLLISRSQEKLDATKQEISSKYSGVNLRTLAVDFMSIDDQATRDKIKAEIEEIKDVGVLLNNVGISYDFPNYFTELSEERVDALLRLNATATTVMTKLVLPGMDARRRGVIVNLSSGSAAMKSMPLLAQYGAAKRYIESFSNSLAAEYKSHNVIVQCHVPMFVTTKLAKIRRATFMIPSPTTYAKAAVANLGYDRLFSPYWPHALQIWLYARLPTMVADKAVMAMHMGIRKKALQKQESKKTQ